MIKFNNVTKVFNNTLKAVDDLSFTVNKGEIVGFYRTERFGQNHHNQNAYRYSLK
jgi:ABC-type multidrug transport system, ATPase component